MGADAIAIGADHEARIQSKDSQTDDVTLIDFYFEFLPAKIDESISILNFFPKSDDPISLPSKRLSK